MIPEAGTILHDRSGGITLSTC